VLRNKDIILINIIIRYIERRMYMKLYVEIIDNNAKLPSYAHDGDAGMDLYSTDEIIILPGERALIHTGIKIQLPPNTEAQIRPRSGLALKNGITLLNTPGTIDEGYRGEIGIIVINHGTEEFRVTRGMKIAQMVIKPVLRVEVEQVDYLNNSERGEGGFGSTGV
jgi:dUTP pyrophosphatase